MEEQYRIFVVEDDDSIRNLTRMHLKMNSFSNVYSLSDAESAWILANRLHPDVIILDLMLPEADGLTFLKWLRNDPVLKDVIIIIITAKDDEEDIIAGLEAGADDYITKPFGMMELVARIKAVLRRTQKEETGEKEYQIGELFVALKQHVVKVGGISITLTSKEFELLSMFIENQSVVFSRDHILNRIWGYEFDGANRTVDVHIGTLRQKLGECGEYIKTVRGYGYKFEQSKEG